MSLFGNMSFAEISSWRLEICCWLAKGVFLVVMPGQVASQKGFWVMFTWANFTCSLNALFQGVVAMIYILAKNSRIL